MNFTVRHHRSVAADGRDGIHNRLPEPLYSEVEFGVGRPPSEENGQGHGIGVLLKLAHDVGEGQVGELHSV